MKTLRLGTTGPEVSRIALGYRIGSRFQIPNVIANSKIITANCAFAIGDRTSDTQIVQTER